MNIEEVQTVEDFKKFIRNYNSLFNYDKLNKYLIQDILIDGIILNKDESLKNNLLRTGIVKWLNENIDKTECKNSIKNLENNILTQKTGYFAENQL